MDANQLADQIAKVIDVVKPPPEYCLFKQYDTWWLCMTKAEWSGWMQAAFSVLAIAFALGAVYLAHFLQSRSEKKKALDLADHSAVRVRQNVREALDAAVPVRAGVGSLLVGPMDKELLDVLLIQLRKEVVSEGDMFHLLAAGGQISTNLNQACAIFKMCASRLELFGGATMEPEVSKLATARLLYSIDNAFAALEEADSAMEKYLASRDFGPVFPPFEHVEEEEGSDQNGMSSSMSSNPDDARGAGAGIGDRAGGGA